eukprot:Sdes_comp20946_c0_seq15m18545
MFLLVFLELSQIRGIFRGLSSTHTRNLPETDGSRKNRQHDFQFSRKNHRSNERYISIPSLVLITHYLTATPPMLPTEENNIQNIFYTDYGYILPDKLSSLIR